MGMVGGDRAVHDCVSHRVRRIIGDLVMSLALGLWLRGLRCVMVLVDGVRVKGVRGPAGSKQVSTLDPHPVDQ